MQSTATYPTRPLEMAHTEKYFDSLDQNYSSKHKRKNVDGQPVPTYYATYVVG
jgi:hypothetical protein